MVTKHHFTESWKRTLIKTISYRIIIIILDVSVIYLLTNRLELAAGFALVSNIYSSVTYFIHERAWNHIHWGKNRINRPHKRDTTQVHAKSKK